MVSIVLLIYILIKNKMIDLHKVWDLAISGDMLSRIYVCLTIGSFTAGVVNVVLLLLVARGIV